MVIGFDGQAPWAPARGAPRQAMIASRTSAARMRRCCIVSFPVAENVI
jgi:hypothetical protein